MVKDRQTPNYGINLAHRINLALVLLVRKLQPCYVFSVLFKRFFERLII